MMMMIYQRADHILLHELSGVQRVADVLERLGGISKALFDLMLLEHFFAARMLMTNKNEKMMML